MLNIYVHLHSYLFTQEIKVRLYTNSYIKVHSNLIHNCPKLEKKMSIRQNGDANLDIFIQQKKKNATKRDEL